MGFLSAEALFSSSQALPSSGNIVTVNVGVYSDIACTQELDAFGWGEISPGASVTHTIYVKNSGNSQVTLSMNAADWSPTEANGPMVLAWDKEGTTLLPEEVTTAMLTLSVAQNIVSDITEFSVGIVVTGTA